MLDNWFYVIPNIVFGILLFLAIKKFKKNINIHGKNYLPFFIISLYFLSASLIYFVKPNIWYPYFHASSYTAMNFTIYSLVLFLYLYPSLYLRPLPINAKIPKTKLLSMLMFLMSLAGIYSFLYQLPYALQGVIIGATDLRLQMNTEDFFLLPKSPLTTFAVGISFFYLFYLVFFFIAISQKKSLFVKIGLLIGSLSYIVSGMAFTTRDVLVFYIFGYLFVYLYFKNLISKRSRQKLRWLYITFGALLLALLLLFSYQRFTSGSIDKLAYGTVGYMAQQPFVFSETLEMQTEYYGGSLRFPIFVSLIDKKVDIERTSPYEWSFGTFIKDFYATGGFMFLFIITFIFVPVFFYKLRTHNKENIFRNIIITLFYFQFMTMGVFYFKLGSRPGNIYMIILLIFYFMTYFRLGERKRIKYE